MGRRNEREWLEGGWDSESEERQRQWMGGEGRPRYIHVTHFHPIFPLKYLLPFQHTAHGCNPRLIFRPSLNFLPPFNHTVWLEPSFTRMRWSSKRRGKENNGLLYEQWNESWKTSGQVSTFLYTSLDNYSNFSVHRAIFVLNLYNYSVNTSSWWLKSKYGMGVNEHLVDDDDHRVLDSITKKGNVE